MKNMNKINLMIFGALTAMATSFVAPSDVQAAPGRQVRKDVILKVEPISVPPAEQEKKQEDRMNAINQALEQSLSERAKSRSDYERHNDRMAIRREVSAREIRATESRLDLDSREVRAESKRDLREETRREKRLNWLND